MKLVGIINELYNSNKLKDKKFKTPDGTITSNVEDLLGYMGLKDDLYNLDDIIDSLQTDIEVIENNKNIKEIEITKDDNCKRFIEYDDNTGHHKYVIRVLDEYFAIKINELIKEINKQKNNEEVL